MRWPVMPTLGIEDFLGGEIITSVSRVTNGIFLPRSNGNLYVTQRPATDINQDASDTVSLTCGRGIFYWDANSAIYFVNDNKVYKNTYATEVNEAGVSVTDIDGDGSTATATATAHGYKTGDKVTISSSTSYNGEHTITVTGADNFTFPSAASTTNETGTAVRGLGGGGCDRVHFFECGDYLVIIDPTDNTGWYIAVGASTTLVEITNTNFPGANSTGGYQLARGGAVLNGTLYVMNTIGEIFNSSVEDPRAWAALDFISAEVESDGGVYLTLHDNHITAFGDRTIEFFYDNANPSNSPLAVRQDIMHSVGTIDYSSIWSDQNTVYFVAQAKTGGLSVYAMRGMQISDISEPDIDTFLTTSIISDGLGVIASGASIGHVVFYFLTIYQTNNSVIEPLETLVYNDTSGKWTTFEMMHTGINDFPVMDWTVATATRVGQGILSNGDIISMRDDWDPVETAGATGGVFESGVFENGVFTAASGGTGANIALEVITGFSDNETRNRKFMSSIRHVGPKTAASQTLTVQWADEQNTTYNTGKTIDTSIPGARVTRTGSYRQRNIKLSYSGDEKVEIDALECDVNEGAY